MFFLGGGGGCCCCWSACGTAKHVAVASHCVKKKTKWRTHNPEGVACPLLLTFEGRGQVVSDMNKKNGYHQFHYM